MSELRVLVVSPSPLARGGMVALLEGLPDVRPVGSTGLVEAAGLAAELLPDVILLDADGGEAEDLEAIAQLSSAHPGLPIVALSVERGPIAQALAFGASALLPMDVDVATLAAALRAATQQLVVIPREEVAALLAVDELVEPTHDTPAESLTPRELEVLQGMARGLTNRQIALRLKISEHTVKFHAGAVLGKLEARSRTEAVARAMRLGWILV
jgi:DNA-binding NarL/FixJ family response regulator